MKYTNWKKIHEYCMAKPCAYETRPFGEYPICYRIAGKIFAQFTPKEDWFKITLKTTVDLNQLDEDIVFQMIDEAYEEVYHQLPEKQQARIPCIAAFSFIKTDGENSDFVSLCEKLDIALKNIIGVDKQKAKYDKLNQRDSIHDVIVIYKGNTPVGCGAYKLYDDETIELKRIYIEESTRGIGLSKELVRRLEADAQISGFRYVVLETGYKLSSAVELYKKMGYKQIPNYGSYVGNEESLCMSKKM